MANPTNWAKSSVNSTNWGKSTPNSTNWAKSTNNSTNWRPTDDDPSAGALLLENSDNFLIEGGANLALM